MNFSLIIWIFTLLMIISFIILSSKYDNPDGDSEYHDTTDLNLYYHRPFKVMRINGSNFIVDSKGQEVLESESLRVLDGICLALNGGSYHPRNVRYTTISGVSIIVDDWIKVTVRGWKYLKDEGLSNSQAQDVQEELGYFIVQLLK